MLYCGIDVAKYAYAVSYVDEKGQVVKAAFPIANTLTGFDEQLQALKTLGEAVTIGQTGSHRPLLAGFVRRFNPQSLPGVSLNAL
jgi:hypothetical protein